MADMMNFPANIKDFIKEYSFIDEDQVYTNGSELIQVYRIYQALEFYAPQLLNSIMKFKSKGEQMMYEWFLKKNLTSPFVHIEKEYDFHNLGCPRHLKSDFLIFYNNTPLGDIEVNGVQHSTDSTTIERDNYKKEWLNNNHIDYIYATYKTYHFLNFSDWYWEQRITYLFPPELYHDQYEDWYHETIFEWILKKIYNNGINLYTYENEINKQL